MFVNVHVQTYSVFLFNSTYGGNGKEMSQQFHKFSLQTIAYGCHFTTWLKRSLQEKNKTAGKKYKIIIGNVFKVCLKQIVIKLSVEKRKKSIKKC